MKPMNDLLADIVVASGGTVTSNTRNGLLDGWLEAVSNPVAALSFVSQPQSKTVDEYALATFSCEVTGGVAPYSYQWKKSGANVGTNSAALSFTAAATDKNASITVTVTDSAGTSITSTAAVLGVTSYVYQLDGLTQYTMLSSDIVIPSATDFEIEVIDTVKSTPSNADARVFANTNNFYSRLLIDLNGGVSVRSNTVNVFTLASGTFTQRDIPLTFKLSRVGSITTLTLGAATYTATGTSAQSYAINSLGYSSGFYAPDSQRNLKVTIGGTLTNQIPLNNKSQGANQLATVGSINATIVNYNEAGWMVI